MSTTAVTPVVETPTITSVSTPAATPAATTAAPVAAAPATENKFETFLSTAAKDIVKFNNAVVNIVTAEQPLLNQILPPQYAATEAAVNALYRNMLLEVEAGYATINPGLTYAQKIARVVAITAPAVTQMLLNIGVQAGQQQLTQLATGATAFANLQTTGLTTLSALPAPTATAATN